VHLKTLVNIRTAAMLSLACLPMMVGAEPAVTETRNSSTDAPTQKISAAENERLLFVQNVPSAKIEKNKEGTHTIILENVSTVVTQFSKRPHRKTVPIAIERFVSFWQDKGTFAASPPNADIVCEVAGLKDAQNYVVVLTNPVYSHDKKLLTYTIQPVEGSAKLPDSATLSHVSLFIDDFCPKCWRPPGS
jgi:hypothetical protein